MLKLSVEAYSSFFASLSDSIRGPGGQRFQWKFKAKSGKIRGRRRRSEWKFDEKTHDKGPERQCGSHIRHPVVPVIGICT